MVKYSPSNSKSTIQEFSLASAPGSVIKVSDRIGYDARNAVQSAMYQPKAYRALDGTEKVELFFDPPAGQKMMLIKALCAGDTWHNLEDENGRPIRITPEWLLFGGLDEFDGMMLAAEVMVKMGPKTGLPELMSEGDAKNSDSSENAASVSSERTPSDSAHLPGEKTISLNA